MYSTSKIKTFLKIRNVGALKPTSVYCKTDRPRYLAMTFLSYCKPDVDYRDILVVQRWHNLSSKFDKEM